MRLWDLIRTLDAQVRPTDTKVHLATHNGIEHPLDLYRDRPERFREWQQWQTKKNFQRPFVIALIELPEARHWLFAGAYSARGSRPDGTGHLYQLIERGACHELDGRLVVQFKRSGRQPYLRAENCADQMWIAEWRAERLSIQKFPGFKKVHIAKTQLDAIVRQRCPDWQAALSNVAGVYLIADSGSGRFYVGSATGAGGIWQRWAEYVTTGHGENIRLVELLKDKSAAARLQFSILEIADTRTDNREILQRESHWKQVLLTRHHGLNA